MKKLPLNLAGLKYFVDAVRQGSISASATKNFVSQSAISQGIAKLERALNCKLIHHQPKRFQITDEGRKLFNKAQGIFQAIRDTEESFFHESAYTIEFACTHSFALALLDQYVKKAQEKFPLLQLKCRLGQAHGIMDMVRKGSVDFGILLDNDDLSAFHCEEIFRGKYRLYVSSKCEDPINLGFLLDSEERTETNLLKKAYKKLTGNDLPVLMEISSWEVVANLTAEGLGIGLFPDYIAEGKKELLKLYSNDIVSIPYRIYAIFAHPNRMSKHIMDFLSLYKPYG